MRNLSPKAVSRHCQILDGRRPGFISCTEEARIPTLQAAEASMWEKPCASPSRGFSPGHGATSKSTRTTGDWVGPLPPALVSIHSKAFLSWFCAFSTVSWWFHCQLTASLGSTHGCRWLLSNLLPMMELLSSSPPNHYSITSSVPGVTQTWIGNDKFINEWRKKTIGPAFTDTYNKNQRTSRNFKLPANVSSIKVIKFDEENDAFWLYEGPFDQNLTKASVKLKKSSVL